MKNEFFWVVLPSSAACGLMASLILYLFLRSL
jgi:hypothetical protein